MAEVYYIQNEKQYRTVIARLFLESGEVDYMYKYNILGCKYEEEGNVNGCCSCELEECRLYNHLENKDKKAIDNMEIYIDNDVEFPIILIANEEGISDKGFILTNVSDAKNNTKYGTATE